VEEIIMLKIEKDVPLPERTYGTASEYPFAEMDIGDSFFVPYGTSSEIERKTLLAKVKNSASYARKKKLGGFAVRGVPGGVRCWKTA
jgi:hypothetical protein